MPHYWFVYETNDELASLLDAGEWAEFKQRVYRELREAGYALDEVFFSESGRPAYALAHTEDDSRQNLDDLAKRWGIRPADEFFTVEEMTERRPETEQYGESSSE